MLRNHFIICYVVFLLTSCGEPLPKDDTFLRIVNNSDQDIFWFFDFERFGNWYEIKSPNSWLEKHETYVILSGKIYVRGFNSDAIKDNLRRGWIKYYLFNLDSIKTIPWERICAERIILKEVTFNSWEDFERCNFEITYP